MANKNIAVLKQLYILELLLYGYSSLIDMRELHNFYIFNRYLSSFYKQHEYILYFTQSPQGSELEREAVWSIGSWCQIQIQEQETKPHQYSQLRKVYVWQAHGKFEDSNDLESMGSMSKW